MGQLLLGTRVTRLSGATPGDERGHNVNIIAQMFAAVKAEFEEVNTRSE
jgi:hypothetical protein